MQWFCLLVQLVDIEHYRYHLPEKIGAYENAMGLSTCVVQLVDPFIMYVCFILTRFVPN